MFGFFLNRYKYGVSLCLGIQAAHRNLSQNTPFILWMPYWCRYFSVTSMSSSIRIPLPTPGSIMESLSPLKSQFLSDAFLENGRPNHSSMIFFLIIVHYIVLKQEIASKEFQFFPPQQGYNKWKKNMKPPKIFAKRRRPFLS